MAARVQPFRELGTSTAAGMRPARRPDAQVLLGVLPFAVMSAVAAADVLAGPGFGLLPLLSLGPVLAAVSPPASSPPSGLTFTSAPPAAVAVPPSGLAFTGADIGAMGDALGSVIGGPPLIYAIVLTLLLKETGPAGARRAEALPSGATR